MSGAQDRPLALVTGASRGIGAALARALAAHGQHPLMVARSESALEQAEEAIHADGHEATLAPLDLNKADDVTKLAGAVAQRWGRLDTLVLNAATLGTLGPLPHADAAEVERVFALNTLAPWRVVAAFDPLLRQARRPVVVAITSSVGAQPRPYWGIYGASKAALDTMMAAYAQEMQALGWRVLVADPGATRTVMRKRAFPGENPESLKPPEAVAEAVIGALEALEPGLSRLEVDREGRARISRPG